MKKYIAILILSACCFFSSIENTKGQDLTAKINELLSAYGKYEMFNGSALVSNQGNVIHKGGYGLANMEWNIENDVDTKHRLGSITKQFTAMLILQLVEEGKLKLDVPISEYIPEYSPQTSSKITIHHLLTHTAGIPNYTSFPGFFNNDSRDPYSPEEFTQYFADSTLQFDPGTNFNYSNSGYFLLGYIIEKVTGNSYEEELQSRIFDPLGMKNSGFDHHDEILSNRATGYERSGLAYINAPYLDMSIPYSAGSMYSTVEDLFLWDQALYTDKLISKELKDQMFTDHVSEFNSGYGYGWGVGEFNGQKEISHGGGINGFNTLIARYPDSKDAVILLNNTGRAPLNQIKDAIMSILNGEEYEMPKKSLARETYTMIKNQGSQEAIAFLKSMKDSEDYNASEQEFNMLGYELLQSDQLADALLIFKANTEMFPDSWNVYDSYGEALVENGDTELAIENYKKSVEMNPGNEHGIEVLKELGVDVESIVSEVQVDDTILASYVGEYELQPGFVITITKDGSQLTAQATGQGSIDIYPKSDTDFYAKVVQAQMIFNKDDEGAVNSFTLLQGGQRMEAKRIK